MTQAETQQLALELLPRTFNIHRLPATSAVPDSISGTHLMCVLRSDQELSIVCDAQIQLESASQVGPWRALRVAGTLDFALVGILSKLTSILAQAEISVFVISSYDTDYLLVRDESLNATRRALEQAGYPINHA